MPTNCYMIEAFLLALLGMGWVAAWLFWTFTGHLRQFIYAKILPQSFRGDKEPGEVMLLTSNDMIPFLSLEAAGDTLLSRWLSKVLTCPVCLSAYLAAPVGIVALLILPYGVFIAPFVWATAAVGGHRIYDNL